MLNDPYASLRPSQRAILEEYNGGRMGISAVPGSGKTFTLSRLAADLILKGDLDPEQEVLVVTLTNSAVDNFSTRIGQILNQSGMGALPGLGFRVRTLHSLAHDIVRERPGLVNLANDFSIIDEDESNAIREQIAETWLKNNPSFFSDYLNAELNEFQLDKIRTKELPRLVKDMSYSFIRYAKDRELTPDALRPRLEELPRPLPLADMGCSIYQEYQRSLSYRGAVDFDDLIRLALAALRADPRLAERLRRQWPFILEDEAQDSSRLQEEILRLLTGDGGHWVRVGDPNQAIYETFTTANPQHLIDFINAPGVLRKELPVSGRSSRNIIRLANHLIDWTREQHPVEEARSALHLPHILPTEPGDPQVNPPNESGQIYFHPRQMTSMEELDVVTKSLIRWQEAQNAKPEEERETLVVLDLMNRRGTSLANTLRDRKIDPVEVLHTTHSTRASAGSLTHILRYLADPQSPSRLSKAFSVWRRDDRGNAAAQAVNKRAQDPLRKLKNVEDFLYPLPGQDWLEQTGLRQNDPEAHALLEQYRAVVRRWHGAALLPIDQVLLTVSQDLFFDPPDLAVAHKLASVLRQKSNSHPTWHLPELSEELEVIAKNKRRFIGFSDDDSGFDPERYRGRIVITTMHKAKGLEWDRVYLLSVNNFDFPSGMPYDQYISEKYYIRGKLNLEAETLAQLRVALSTSEYEWYEESRATLDARMDTVRERLRLLYVAITRAKKSLIITWNSGNNGRSQAALPLLELQQFFEKMMAEP